MIPVCFSAQRPSSLASMHGNSQCGPHGLPPTLKALIYGLFDSLRKFLEPSGSTNSVLIERLSDRLRFKPSLDRRCNRLLRRQMERVSILDESRLPLSECVIVAFAGALRLLDLVVRSG
jgi:hypothetical protein